MACSAVLPVAHEMSAVRRYSMIPGAFREIQRRVMSQDTVPQFGLRTRDDLVGLRQFMNVGSAG